MSTKCHCHTSPIADVDLHPRMIRDCENCESAKCRETLHHAEAHASHHGADAHVKDNMACCCTSGTCCCSKGECGSQAKVDSCCRA